MLNHRPVNGPARSSGAALILVLAFLVLITVFVIAFFSSVTTERAPPPKDYANQVSTKQLADSAVQSGHDADCRCHYGHEFRVEISLGVTAGDDSHL